MVTEAHVTRKPAECDRPAPDEHTTPVTHSHDDGRRCLWENDAWVTVSANSEPVLIERQPIDQKAIGFYGKFHVARSDGRDQPGGDRADASRHYFVLDPIFDPLARPALALYAMLAREQGYEKLADDIQGNLLVLAKLQSESMDTSDPEGNERSLRAVATWTYNGYGPNYAKEKGQRVGADEMARADTDNLAADGTIDELIELSDREPDVWVLPDA